LPSPCRNDTAFLSFRHRSMTFHHKGPTAPQGRPGTGPASCNPA
jgi:hypothetical protein